MNERTQSLTKTQQPTVRQAAQLKQDAAGLAPESVFGLGDVYTLPRHATTRPLRQAALLQQQRLHGNAHVQGMLLQRCQGAGVCHCPACMEEAQRQAAPDIQRDGGGGSAPVTLPNPTIIVRPDQMTWRRWTAAIVENSPTNYTLGVGCLPGGVVSYTMTGQAFIRSQDTGAEIPYTRANHRRHFPGRPFLSDVNVNVPNQGHNITFSTNGVATLGADGRFTLDFNQTSLRQAVRSLRASLVLRDPGMTDGIGSRLTLQSIQGPDELISVCEDALNADFTAAAASQRAAQQAGRLEPMHMGPPAGAIPVAAGELDRINYYLSAAGLELGTDGVLQALSGWTAPDRWRWIARNQIWNEGISAPTAPWTARYIYDWLRQVRDAYFDENAAPISFSIFIGELRRYEDEHPGQSIDDTIRALRRAGHEQNLPFDQVIGVPAGRHEEYSTGGVGGAMQFLKDHNRVTVGGRVVDIYHLAVGLEALPLDRPDVELEIPLGRGTLVMPTGMESAAAATWAGDVGSALTDWYMGVDARGEPAGSMEDKLDYYWRTRVAAADLDGDIEAWGIHNTRPTLPANLRRLSDLLLHHYGNGMSGINRREAYRQFARYYSPRGSTRMDILRLRTQIKEFARMWFWKRLREGYGPRYRIDEYEWGADELASRFMLHVEDQM